MKSIKLTHAGFVIRFFFIAILTLALMPTAPAFAGSCGSGTWIPGNLEVHHINIGQGDSTLIVGPGGKSLLFDAGESYWNSSAKAQIIGPYIESVLGCKSLDYVVISHFHLDHVGYVGYGGLWHLVENQGFTVGSTLVRDYNTYLGDVSGTFTNWKGYLEGAGDSKLHPVTVVDGTSQVDLGPGVMFNVVAHDGNGAIIAGRFNGDASPPSENDYSVGAVLSYGAFDEWIGGDLDGQYEIGGFGYTYHDIELSVAPEVGDVDVYKVNHHASAHSSSSTFVNQLDPEVSIVTVGDGNTHGHPTQSIMDRLLATSTVYMTERGNTSTNIGSAVVAGNIVIKTSDGFTYTVNGAPYTATEPARTDADGDGYFAEADSNDNDTDSIPSPNGGCGSIYQTCSVYCQAIAGQVLINEIFPAPSSGGSEWVELYNTTESTINISYCHVDDIAGGSAAYQIPPATLIPSHGFWTLDRTNYFNNTGDDVRFLKENASTVLDIYTFGNTGQDLSWYRFPDGGAWAESPTASSTKGSRNAPVFVDVPLTYWAEGYIERLYNAGVTGGCLSSPLSYCPENPVTRAQMAVFLLKGVHGSSYAPPSVGGDAGFGDVLPTHWAAAWIKQLATEGITSGCGDGNYCPDNPVTRAQMAVFLLKSKNGVAFIPPDAIGVFNDVPVGYWADKWIEQLAREGITSGCGAGVYCPDDSVTRAQMAVFLVKTFGLP